MYRDICIHSSSEQHTIQVNVTQARHDDLMNSRPKQVDIKSVTRRFWHVMVCETCDVVTSMCLMLRLHQQGAPVLTQDHEG